MPVFNSDQYLAEAIESILDQTYRDFEFLIMNDGSTDNSLKIIKKYALIDQRIHFWTHSNKGVTVTLNDLLKESHHDLIARMDADDISLPERFAKQVEFLDKNPDYVAIGCKVQTIDPAGRPLGQWCDKQTHEAIEEILINPFNAGVTVIAHSGVMYRRKSVFAIGDYNESIKQSQDLDLWLRLIENGGKLANLPDTLLKVRLHNDSSCHRYFENMWKAGQIAVRNSRQRRGLPELPFVEPDKCFLLDQGKNV